ncbi:hypothetical protein E2C01_093924 [Portunus trituberculatus]|uniref:Uncharacterized protein n=1 Tax=Portunus trituberculatus TaxID=210409 RepID=A0A5B7JP18_PORTR|nr:hypothetical protein [Portunus trituberculatus]
MPAHHRSARRKVGERVGESQHMSIGAGTCLPPLPSLHLPCPPMSTQEQFKTDANNAPYGEFSRANSSNNELYQ